MIKFLKWLSLERMNQQLTLGLRQEVLLKVREIPATNSMMIRRAFHIKQLNQD